MAYLVIARKWRPQQFGDVVGQQTVVRTLQNAILQGRVSHAYLFTGTRGVGKTSTARILAKALNCQSGPTPVPCDACDSCREVMQGNSVDVLEIDAASNRRIDEIRELRENVRYSPSRDRYKIFIIDEVHMLTPEAFNALLKTLEEPPGHVVFILATTDLYRLPQTIVSRCQQFDFRVIPPSDLFVQIRKILEAEKMALSDATVWAIVKAGAGSMRDAESALQKIVSFGDGAITDADAATLLGVVRQEFVLEMMGAVVRRDEAAIIRIVGDLYDNGHDLQNFLRAFVELVRLLAVAGVMKNEDQLAGFSEEDLRRFREFASHFRTLELIRMYELSVRADNEMKWVPFIRFHTEMLFLKLAALPDVSAVEQILAAMGKGQAPPAPRPHPRPTAPLAPARPPVEAAPPRHQPLAPSAPAHRIEAVIVEPFLGPAECPAPPAASEPLPEPAPPEPAKPGPAQPPPTDRERLGLFVREAESRIPQIRSFLSEVEWRIEADRLHVMVQPGSFVEKSLRMQTHQDRLKEAFRDLFGAVPEVVITPRQTSPAPRPTPPDTGKAVAGADAERKIEERFMEHAAARVVLENLPGRWAFKPEV